MTTVEDVAAPIELPKIPAPVKDFISYFSGHPKTPAAELLEPFKNYESELRKIYAQQPDHEAVKDGLTNTVPIFAGHGSELKIRARSLATESAQDKEKYLMPLHDSERKPDGTPAVVTSLKEFQHNFNLFSESSLGDLDWSNVVAAGSSVTTALLPVPEKWAGSKRSLREYYHEHLAPASDVDLFLYGLNEEEAIEKIKQIETKIKDSILHETTTIRTKNAITIASQYPTRHVQIVLRLYDSISQIITGFDVDCSCAAYNGSQVYASPRALVAFATQINTIDLTRRSPSYENRLSKYSHRGFEVHWPLLDRSRVDPTIFERSFSRTNGLARLLVLEKLPKSKDRDAYMDQRRVERGRPPANRSHRDQHRLRGNVKDNEEDDVAEWVEEDEVSNYHTIVVPYGKRFNASKINKLLYTKDLLLNAEWNIPKEREVHLHRHPCFFGSAEDVIGDCCGFCPVPHTDEEIEIAKEESKIYISGKLTFIKDNPGRQEIGSFNPITTDDWCEMAFVGNTQMLCQAIVDGDVEYVRSWCTREGNDLDTRDYCGRTPLHLAVIAASTTVSQSVVDDTRKSSLEIVQCLIDNGARIVARLVDGRTALHLAAAQGNIEIVKALMRRSLANEEEEAEKEEQRKVAKKVEKLKKAQMDSKKDGSESADETDIGGDSDDMEDSEDSDQDSVTMGSFVKVQPQKPQNSNEIPEDIDEPDFYDINVLAWDFQTSPLHLAIVNGHVDVIRLLVEEYGADVLLPIKLLDYNYSSRAAILTLALTLSLPKERAKEVAKVLLELGATSGQADMNHLTALHYIVAENNSDVLDVLFNHDGPAAHSVLNYVAMGSSNTGNTALTIALKLTHEAMVTKLLALGAKTTISFDDYIRSFISKHEYAKNWNPDQSMQTYLTTCVQPLFIAAVREMPKTMEELLARGADPCTLDTRAYSLIKDQKMGRWQRGASILDFVREKLKSLMEYKELDEHEPEELKDESFYTFGLRSGRYEYWSALNQFQEVKKSNAKARELYWKKVAAVKDGNGVREKRESISQLIRDFNLVEKVLVDAGAKTLREMHPDIVEYQPPYPSWNSKPVVPKPFATQFSFNIPDLNDRLKEGYLNLFEAAWRNDIDEIKYLTLGAWKSKVDDVENQPLRVAVQDQNGFSPFSIAVLRGHYKLGRAIVEIALAQYEPEDRSGRRERWTIDSYDGDDSDSETDGPRIYSEIVDETFTIENVAAISTTVKSRVDPLTMIKWNCNAHWFMEGDWQLHAEVDVCGMVSLMDHAVKVDNMALFKFLLQISAEHRANVTDDGRSDSYTVDRSLFNTAIQLGRTALLGELIKATGVGIPFDELVEKSGVRIKDKPRYYQGLNVGGKKREDWAQAGRGRHGYRKVGQNDKQIPLLRAAYYGSIESVQWFLSDAPLRRYAEFAAANNSDKRVRALEQSTGRFEKTIGTWLHSRGELSLHCAILWNPSPETTTEHLGLLKYLLSAIPESLEHKSSQGFTPLHIAVAVKRPEIVELLIAAGANQRACDASGRNAVHMMVQMDPDRLRTIIGLFNKSHVKEMLLERCNLESNFSSLTPLAYWMAKNGQLRSWNGLSSSKKLEVIKILTEHSQGDDMELITGDGDLPLHQAVKQGLASITSYLISIRPELLHRENATGRTPLEMAADLYLQDRVSQPPNFHDGFSYQIGDPSRLYGRNIRIDLIKRPASSFVSNAEKEEPSKKRTYEICVEAAQKYPAKRRLVSLFEANEVAKRLAGMNIQSRTPWAANDHDEREMVTDEVSHWMVAI